MSDKLTNENNMSYQGMAIVANGTVVKCSYCGKVLKGERFCPECNSRIEYKGEKWIAVGEAMKDTSESLTASGEKMKKAGANLTLTVTIPIILLLILLALL